MSRRNVLIFLGFAVTAFAAERKAHVPQTPLPEQWSEASHAALPAELDEIRNWWRSFNDALLTSLVEREIGSNLDLKAAVARVIEARAAKGLPVSAMLPSVGASAGFTRLRGGIAQGLTGVGILPGGAPQSRSSVISPFETNVYQAGFDSSWELDLFGGLRKGVQAADADLKAAGEAQNATRVTLVAELGRNYMTLRGAQRRLAIVLENISLQRDSLKLTEARRNAGLAPELDVIRAAAQLSQTRADAPSIQLEIEQSIHGLSVLLRRPPEELSSELRPERPLPSIPGVVPIGLPADLIHRRPDLLRADAEIAAAEARLGVARSELYPKLTLAGLVGRQSNDITHFGLGVGNFFSLGPALRLPLFTGGRIRSNIAVQVARLEEAEIAYQQTVLSALAEVENALSASSRENEREDLLREAERQNRDAVSLTRELYSKGLGDYLAVLDAQRELLSTQQQLAQSQTALLVDTIALYKALGGGW
jgi:NodT family efflux transporter outer membrane factor (OMF) lipoprotein